MKDLVRQTFANGMLGLSVVGGGISSMLKFMDLHGVALGLMLSFFFGCGGLWISWYKNNKPEENARRLEKQAKEIKELQQQATKDKENNLSLTSQLTAIEERKEKR